MNYPFTDAFDKEMLRRDMMGPNSMRVTEELAAILPPGALAGGKKRILDLGCGKGLSSILLAGKYPETTVFAVDLWITATENAERFASLGPASGVGDRIIPIHADASQGLPFAERYFDAIVSVDAWHYFGDNEATLPAMLRYLKTGGTVAVAVPGLKREFPGGETPEEMRPYWGDGTSFHSCDWWEKLWGKAAGITDIRCREMDCLKQAWDEWLECDNPHAKGDIPMMAAEGGRYFNLVHITGKKS